MNNYFQKTTSAAPLAIFRIALGLLLFGSIIRFWAKGWIHELYISPKYFFPFYGFEFVTPLGEYTYVLFAVCGLSALLVAVGLFYRISSITLFISFTYIELIDKSTYLNHYYFVSMICLLMLFLPAQVYFSVDAYRDRQLLSDRIPQWSIDAIKFFVCIVYVFAGLAKINSDWLLEAQPLRIWLPAKNDIPLIGPLFNHVWVAYMFCWMGCIYDLTVTFLLLNRSTRAFAYFAVVIFHLLTALLFPIGMFPYIMIATALIFFSGEFHQNIINKIGSWIRVSKEFLQPEKNFQYGTFSSRGIIAILMVFLLVQIALPVRYLLYPGELFWTEEGYRFSWRVMLMEKAGFAEFTVKDIDGKQILIDNREFLTPLQEKMMSAQPDMILQYAHILRDHYINEGFTSPEIYVDSYVALNGRLGKPLIDAKTDLAKEIESFDHKPWILTFNDEIKGL
ncbi:MAG: HTTM domain-containing protein [Marivirga sp.]|nr:HTTM domain-containing protein [Marivirga sp.]